MNRRHFLKQSSFCFFASYLGSHLFSKAFGCDITPGLHHPNPQIALIIDDIGYSPYMARRFLRLGIPITFSVLPHLPSSHKLAVELRSEGHEVMLHQPMEPFNAQNNPGPGALYVGYDAGKISRIINENISNVPHAVGVNNHMGSRFTSSQHEITQALQTVKDSGLFFVDSLTTSRSKAYCVAQSLHIPTACRNFFLDHVRQVSDIRAQLEKLSLRAKHNGRAIGIGHPFAETIEAIGDFLNSSTTADVSFVHVSSVI